MDVDDNNHNNEKTSYSVAKTLEQQGGQRLISQQSNKTLTPEERIAKQQLKKLLKRQQKLKKLEVRLQQAITRKNVQVERQTREELKIFYEKEKELYGEQCSGGDHYYYSLDCSSTQNADGGVVIGEDVNSFENRKKRGLLKFTMEEVQGRDLIQSIYDKLIVSVLHKDKEQQQQEEQDTKRLKQDSLCEIQKDTSPTTTAATIAATTTYKVRKVTQNKQAKQLCQHMTKGTQTVGMFDNQDALRGYTRLKFQERAFLVLSSLRKLDPALRQQQQLPQGRRLLEEQVWSKLLAVQNVCSIGCGPGCDMVGVIGFLKAFAANNKNNTTNKESSEISASKTKKETSSSPQPFLHRVILMDWAIKEWDIVVIKPLTKILVPDYVNVLMTSFCDVCQPLLGHNSNNNDTATKDNNNKEEEIMGRDNKDDKKILNSSKNENKNDNKKKVLPSSSSSSSPNFAAAQLLTSSSATADNNNQCNNNNGCSSSSSNESFHKNGTKVIKETDMAKAAKGDGLCHHGATTTKCDMDLFLISYLLTETRGKWQSFFMDLISIAKPGALFFFSDPTAWQMHLFMRQTETMMDFIWLDSSMNQPLLQVLEGRIGPAILLGIKR